MPAYLNFWVMLILVLQSQGPSLRFLESSSAVLAGKSREIVPVFGGNQREPVKPSDSITESDVLKVSL